MFLTGATGFLGKAILEKIIREDLYDSPQIFLLIRDSRTHSAQERLEVDIMESPIWERVIKEHFNNNVDKFRDLLLDKLICITGDVVLPDFAISASDLKKLDGRSKWVVRGFL